MTLPQQDARIIAMRAEGKTAREMASEIGSGESYVRCRLRKLGLLKGPLLMRRRAVVDDVWELPDDKRRDEVARRAARGARATLESQSKG